MPMQVVEVRCAGRAVGPEVRNRQEPAHRQRRLPRVREPGVARRVAVVVGTHHDARLRIPVPKGPRHRREVAGVEGHGHRMACGLVDARSGREPFDDTDDIARCDARFTARVVALLAQQAVEALYACALEEALGAARADELQAVQRARRVASGNDQRTPVHAQAMRLHVLAGQIRVIRRCRPRCRPDARGAFAREFMAARRLLAALDAGGLCAQT